MANNSCNLKFVGSKVIVEVRKKLNGLNPTTKQLTKLCVTLFNCFEDCSFVFVGNLNYRTLSYQFVDKNYPLLLILVDFRPYLNFTWRPAAHSEKSLNVTGFAEEVIVQGIAPFVWLIRQLDSATLK